MDLVTPIIHVVSHVMDCSTKHLNYLCALQENLSKLEDKMAQLIELKSDVNNKVIIEEEGLKKRTNQVDGWMKRVEDSRPEVEQIIREGAQHLEKRCLNGCCPKNCWSNYKLCKKVVKKLLLVEELKRDGVFEIVAENPPCPPVQELPENFTVGLDSEFENALSLLRKDDIQVLGLYGVGGVGKTTLLKKINNGFQKRNNDFDVVIWVLISSEVKIETVQEAIRVRLGLNSWSDSDPLSSRASHIHTALKKKKFLILLDDVWEELDLLSIGIPLPSVENKSKIVLSTRSLDVCGAMGANKAIEVKSLNKEQSWVLFQKKVGQQTLDADPQIPKLAETVAEKCHGLPLVLITIGASMASKTNPREWKRAILELNKSAAKFPGMTGRVLHLLKFSYDKLPSSTDRVCFLFCALYPEDYSISKDDLIYKWIGVGYIGGFEDFEEALNIGHGIIGTLKRTCLLEKGDNDNKVKMHDVIRELALWIIGRDEGKVIVKSGYNLKKFPIIDLHPTVVQTISLMHTGITHLEKLPSCPNLSTFFAPNNEDLNHIIDDFFLSMPNLKFLDLSFSKITKLPTSICELFELEFLNLSFTNITNLPFEMRNLTKLKVLNLFERKFAIPRGMMMNFSNLESLELDVLGSDDSSEEMHVDIDDFKYLNKLKCLVISISVFKDLERLLSNPRLCNCLKYLGIQNCKEITLPTLSASSSSHLSLGRLQKLQFLRIHECSEIKEWKFDCITNVDEPEIGLFESLEKMFLDNLPKLIISWDARNLHCAHFRKLHFLHLYGCHAMVNLTWLLLIPNLQTLRIFDCSSLQEIISSSEESGGGGYPCDENTTFSNLKRLELFNLPNLQSICSHTSALSFPYLETIDVTYCPKLRRLPLDSNSAKNTLKMIKGEADWWDGLEWDNETTKTQFANSVYVLFYANSFCNKHGKMFSYVEAMHSILVHLDT
ncbi:hypothetical protein AQUCO_03900180v1 [Aquilegia coerulea]|uniref:Uncharacterized protein n=1 Tax=Aquilegia coerulea TaxID=218851 RepID=A0A2G5CS43_AQUCA|nr:hypothetical protein AQUCO_03900180v1 [Aquilegia coerulea]